MPRKDHKMIRRRLVNAYLTSIISISLVLLLIGVASMVVVNASKLVNYLKENMKLSVLLIQEADQKQAESYAKSIEILPYISSVRVISKEEGAAEMAEMLGEDFLKVFESSPIPISVEVGLKAEYVVPDSLAFITPLLAKSSLVDEIDSQQSLVTSLNDNLTKISLVFSLMIALLLFISIALINNMVRLSVFARRFTIHTMKLVGATKSFIIAPFVRASVIQALIAAVISSGVLCLLFAMAKKSFAELFVVFDTPSLLLSIVLIFVSSVLICSLSTCFVVNKIVSAPKDSLYY